MLNFYLLSYNGIIIDIISILNMLSHNTIFDLQVSMLNDILVNEEEFKLINIKNDEFQKMIIN